jgi:hypothetical protein
MLFSVWMKIFIPMVDASATELDPGHTHIVIGAKTAEEIDQALYAHQHTGGGLQLDDQPIQAKFPSRSISTRVISLSSSQAATQVLVGFNGLVWLVSFRLSAVNPSSCLTQAVSRSILFPASCDLTPLEPPPKAS